MAVAVGRALRVLARLTLVHGATLTGRARHNLCAAGPLRSGRVRAGLLLTHAAVDRKAAVLAANELATGACSDLPPAVFGIGILARLANTLVLANDLVLFAGAHPRAGRSLARAGEALAG